MPLEIALVRRPPVRQRAVTFAFIKRKRFVDLAEPPLDHRAGATKLARYTDGQGRPLKQRELCARHADWLRANRPNVRDLRGAPDA